MNRNSDDAVLNYKLIFNSLISEASFKVPKLIKPSAWTQHAPFAFFIIEAIKPNIIVELGTHYGYSFFTFCQAIYDFKLNSHCYAVDNWIGDVHSGYYDNSIFLEVESYTKKNYDAFAHLLRMNFNEALDLFDDKSIDLLHIDGRHYFDDVKQDFLDWLPKLSDNSIVLFHDIQVKDRGFGVHQFWDKIKILRPHFEFYHNHGLGVLHTGSIINKNIENLFYAQNIYPLANSIRFAYERLGLCIDLVDKC